jgi:hypothetical protein
VLVPRPESPSDEGLEDEPLGLANLWWSRSGGWNADNFVLENILSQCDNLILMRMNSSGDRSRLAEAFSMVPSPLIERSATFLLGEGLAVGKITPDPLLFKTGRRMIPEGGLDLPASWAHDIDSELEGS